MSAECLYKEWDSLSHLLYLVPEKDQKFGFLPGIDIEITTLDVCANLLIVGTNTAIVYVIDRRKHSLLLKLKCGNRSDGVTSICTGSNNDVFTVVAGSRTGHIYLYRLQMSHNTLDVIHSMNTTLTSQSTLRSIQLTPDCDIVYCGDDSGDVTVLDATQNSEFEPHVLLNESQPIIQLSLWTHLLMVSTTAHSLILNLISKQTAKMGTKPRKINGTFGGSLHGGNGSDVAVFSVRPGLRLWRCTVEGTVVVTHMFKDLVSQAHVIRLQGEAGFKCVTEALTQFGVVKMVDNNTLISWTEQCVVLIDISDAHSSALIGICSMCNITDVACYGGDVYILGGGATRRLHRLAKSSDVMEAESSTEGSETDLSTEITEASSEENVELPPIVETTGLIELNLAVTIETDPEPPQEDEEGEKEETNTHKNLKAIEAKFSSGLTTVKEKLAVSGDDVKHVGQTVKHGFGSFLTKIQAITPHRKPSSPQPEPDQVTELADETVADDKPLGDSVSGLVHTKSDPNISTRNTADGDSNVDEVSYRNKRHSLPERQETLSSDDDDNDDSNLVIRLAPEKQRSAGALSSSVDLTDSTSHGDVTSSANQIESSNSFQSTHSQSSNEILSSNQVNNEPAHDVGTEPHDSHHVGTEPDYSHDVGMEPTPAPDIGAEPVKDSTEPLTDIDSTSKDPQADDPPDEEEEDDDTDEHASGEELMSRLNKLLTTKESKEYNFLQQAIESERAVDRPDVETTSDLHEEDVGDESDTEERLSETPTSDDDDDEEDIYKPKQILKDPSGIHFVSAEDELTEEVVIEEPVYSESAFSKVMNSEHWSCDSVMSPPAVICITNSYVWMKGSKSSAVWVAKSTDPTLIWRKLDIKAHGLSVAPSGCLAWRVYKGTAYAGHCKTRPFTPWSMKWTVAVQGVASVAVDEHCAWYIKTNGEVWLQSNLSKDRPMKHGVQVACKHNLVKIFSRNDVTWGLTSDGRIYYLTSTGRDTRDWVSINDANNIADLCLSFDGSNCWLIDTDDELWCMTDLSSRQPVNSNQIWQVVFYEGMNAENRHKVRNLFSSQSMSTSPTAHSLVSASNDIVSVFHANSSDDINVARTHTIGYRWKSVSLAAFTSTVKWKSVSSMGDEKLVAMYDTGELFYLDLSCNTATNVNLPAAISNQSLRITQIQSCTLSLWLILSNGTVYYTTDISTADSIRLGLNWRPLNTCQFANQQIKSVSVGRHAAWAVDASGAILLSMGVNAKRQSRLMSPAWIPVDAIAKSEGFKSVHVNDRNSMVWALDINGNVFARRGVTAQLPIGTSWVQVIGIQCKQLSISDSLVWAIGKDSQLFCRVGITDQQFIGELWKRVPASVCHIAVSSSDGLSGLTSTGQLVSLHTRVIGEVKERAVVQQQVEDDWELV